MCCRSTVTYSYTYQNSSVTVDRPLHQGRKGDKGSSKEPLLHLEPCSMLIFASLGALGRDMVHRRPVSAPNLPKMFFIISKFFFQSNSQSLMKFDPFSNRTFKSKLFTSLLSIKQPKPNPNRNLDHILTKFEEWGLVSNLYMQNEFSFDIKSTFAYGRWRVEGGSP